MPHVQYVFILEESFYLQSNLDNFAVGHRNHRVVLLLYISNILCLLLVCNIESDLFYIGNFLIQQR